MKKPQTSEERIAEHEARIQEHARNIRRIRVRIRRLQRIRDWFEGIKMFDRRGMTLLIVLLILSSCEVRCGHINDGKPDLNLGVTLKGCGVP